MQTLCTLTLGRAALLTSAATGSAQVPRASDGHPDLSGIWQAIGTASLDLKDHPSELKCSMPGNPRAAYLPQPFQIVM